MNSERFDQFMFGVFTFIGTLIFIGFIGVILGSLAAKEYVSYVIIGVGTFFVLSMSGWLIAWLIYERQSVPRDTHYLEVLSRRHSNDL